VVEEILSRQVGPYPGSGRGEMKYTPRRSSQAYSLKSLARSADFIDGKLHFSSLVL
jgi:hypothetical protein